MDTGLTTDVAGNVGNIYNDGSVLVPATGAIYAPEVGDDVLWDMRVEFDRKHGITVGRVSHAAGHCDEPGSAQRPRLRQLRLT